jgi:SAM-dependent methyltransferase
MWKGFAKSMHSNSYKIMQKLIAPFKGGNVVDVGSLDINGTYRPLFGPSWKYTGVDIVPGKNVSFTMVSEYSTGIELANVDLVISGQTIEHCRNPFRLVAEMARILKPGGALILIAPFIWNQHRYPVDCWRFLPDGMKILIEDAGLSFVKSEISFHGNGHKEADCWAVGKKI